MFKSLTNELESFRALDIPALDCIVYHRGECVYRHFSGCSDYENSVPLTGNERYNIYSSTKHITATAMMQLYEKGEFKLDDPLYLYLPEFEHMSVQTDNGIIPAKKQITIRHLLTMTSGYSYDTRSPLIDQCRRETGGRCQTRELMPYLAQMPLLFEPGDRFNYGLSHDIIGAVIEVISGMTLGEYVKKNIFYPLGMAHSTYSLPDQELDSVVAHYRWDEAENRLIAVPKTAPHRHGYAYESGGAGCVTTVEDYIKFLEAIRIGDVILKKETVDLMATNQLNDRQLESCYATTPFLAKYGYGYGLGIRCPREGTGLTDFGWEGAAGAFPAVDPAHEMTLFYVQHVLQAKTVYKKLDLLPITQKIIEKL